jgi:hypothetical protein
MQSHAQMPLSPGELLASERLLCTESVPWGETPKSNRSGIYVVSLGALDDVAPRVEPNLEVERVARWIERVPTLLLRGERPTAPVLCTHLGRWWLPDQAVLYIGKTDDRRGLARRVGAYYKTVLGDAGPHSGGHWIKAMSDLTSLNVHTADVIDERRCGDIESRLLATFMRSVSADVEAKHPDGALTLPFANLEWRKDGRRFVRKHEMSGTRLKRANAS